MESVKTEEFKNFLNNYYKTLEDLRNKDEASQGSDQSKSVRIYIESVTSDGQLIIKFN